MGVHGWADRDWVQILLLYGEIWGKLLLPCWSYPGTSDLYLVECKILNCIWLKLLLSLSMCACRARLIFQNLWGDNTLTQTYSCKSRSDRKFGGHKWSKINCLVLCFWIRHLALQYLVLQIPKFHGTCTGSEPKRNIGLYTGRIICLYSLPNGTCTGSGQHDQTWHRAALLRPSVINSYSASSDNWCTGGGDGGCRVGEVRAATTSPMPGHKGFKLQ